MYIRDTANLPSALRGKSITQIALLVPDLAVAVSSWSHVLDRSDWLVYTYGPRNVPRLFLRGQPVKFTMRLAISGACCAPIGTDSAYPRAIDLS